MKFKLNFNMDNAAFGDPDLEIARILHEIADKVERGIQGGPVRDINGNNVGAWTIIV